ncbi:hypothetical protein [Dactylosporangium sp. CA-092794]|uniref:hypothetical protein n=1 Tax=Dactylosporangium sp. CA-092794 TaxID=3239929 RepID=UPI003D8B87D5
MSNIMNSAGSARTLSSVWIYSSGVASVYCSPSGYAWSSYYLTIQFGDGTTYTSPLL